MRLNKQGLPKSPEKTERQCTLFVVSMDFLGGAPRGVSLDLFHLLWH